MIRTSLGYSAYVIAALSLPLLGLPTLADDKTPPDKKATVDKPTIEFKTISAGSDSNTTKLFLTVELEGSDEKFADAIGLAGASCRGGLQAVSFGSIFKQHLAWKYTADYEKGTLVIEGWTDPKTNKFHQVKKITFESLNVPKENMPTVKMPPSA